MLPLYNNAGNYLGNHPPPHPSITDWNIHILWKLVNQNFQEDMLDLVWSLRSGFAFKFSLRAGSDD